ncbi:MAG TPA: hypothetical protein PKI33_12720, partial [Anaerolineales bacterium]|nr:hypothetical protein [Anaerolineales bacterium]
NVPPDVVIRFGETIPPRDWKSFTVLVRDVTKDLITQTPQSPFEELHHQNQELFDALENYLGDRTLDRDARRIYAEAECGELDGGAGRRLVNMIKNRI